MDAKFLLSTLLLILLGCGNGGGSGEMFGEVLANETDHHHPSIDQDDPYSSSHMHHPDPATIVFFLLEDLKQGNTMSVHFPSRNLSDSFTHLLPKDKADTIPFSSQHFLTILRLFSFPRGSPQAKAIHDTLKECERQPIKDETKICATSMESMMEFIKTILGSKTQPESLSTIHLTKSNTPLQKYTIIGIKRIPGPKTVACHTMPYPYTVFYCHNQVSESRVYRVSLTGENGDKVEAIALCHMDTSLWGRNHVSFRVLGIEPGTSPVCHFFPADNFVWVLKSGRDVM